MDILLNCFKCSLNYLKLFDVNFNLKRLFHSFLKDTITIISPENLYRLCATIDIVTALIPYFVTNYLYWILPHQSVVHFPDQKIVCLKNPHFTSPCSLLGS